MSDKLCDPVLPLGCMSSVATLAIAFFFTTTTTTTTMFYVLEGCYHLPIIVICWCGIYGLFVYYYAIIYFYHFYYYQGFCVVLSQAPPHHPPPRLALAVLVSVN